MGKKKITTVHIDEEVLKKAKKEINNISVFFEQCLKAYLGLDNGNFNISTIDDELEKMKQANLNIHLLTGKEELENVNMAEANQEINEAWINIWREYRVSEECDPRGIARLETLVDYSYNEILDIMESLLINCDRKQLLKCETFEGAVNQYKQI